MKRKYMPTIAQLIDRLSIATLKSVKIPENKKEYEEESHEIMHDLNLLYVLKKIKNPGQFLRAVQVNAIANEIIWQNESKARQGGAEQDHLLKFTHSVNGVRSQAMNVISHLTGERKDLKIDCLAADICKKEGYDFGGIWEKKK